jgi:hypothetical protein
MRRLPYVSDRLTAYDLSLIAVPIMTCFAPDCLSVCLLMASDGATLPSRHLDLHSPVFDWVVFPFAAQLKDEPVVPPFGRAEPKVARPARSDMPGRWWRQTRCKEFDAVHRLFQTPGVPGG